MFVYWHVQLISRILDNAGPNLHTSIHVHVLFHLHVYAALPHKWSSCSRGTVSEGTRSSACLLFRCCSDSLLYSHNTSKLHNKSTPITGPQALMHPHTIGGLDHYCACWKWTWPNSHRPAEWPKLITMCVFGVFWETVTFVCLGKPVKWLLV